MCVLVCAQNQTHLVGTIPTSPLQHTITSIQRQQGLTGNTMQSLFSVCLHAHMFPCVQRKLSTTGVMESNSSGGDPQDLLPPNLPTPFLPPFSSLSPSSSYHPYTACPGETAVEDIMLYCVCVRVCMCVRDRKMKRKTENTE